MVAGKEIGRLTVRVLPDTSLFRQQLKRELEAIGDIEIPVKADTDGLREEVSAAVKAAEAGQKINVPMDVDRDNFNRSLKDAAQSSRPKLDFQVDESGLRDPLQSIADELRVTPEIDDDSFRRRMRELLEPVQLPIEPDLADRNVQREIDHIQQFGPINFPINLDDTNLSARAKVVRAEAAKILEKDQLRLKLAADDDQLQRQIADARARLVELNEMGVSPKYDGNALRQAQGDLQRYLNKLDELQKKKTYSEDQQGQLQKLKFDLEIAQNNFERLNSQMQKMTSNPLFDKHSKEADDFAKKVLDAFYKAQQLEKKIRDIRESKIDPKIDLDIADTLRKVDQLEGRIRDIRASGSKMQFDADVGKAMAEIRKLEAQAAKVQRERIKIRAELDTNQVNRAFSALRATTSREVERVGDGISGISNAFSKAGLGAKSFTDNLAAMGNRIQAIQAATQQAFTLFVKLPALAFALSVAGAGITAAWGAVSTAIAAVNPALALLGVAAGTVWLGFDGIKEAAGTLIPELGRLKVAASDAFERGLTPAFERLRALMPTVEAGVVGVATSLSRVGDNVSKMLVNWDRMGRLQTIFDNVRTSIDALNPSIVSILDSMSRVMTLESGFRVLTGAVDEFARAFDRGVTKTMSDGSLDRAFRGLEGTLRALSRGFVELVTNGIQVFAGAAPGVNKFLNSLTDFFGRFNWERLGRAVGNVFDGLGKALDNVPDSTIEGITQAFEKLGDLFQDPAFQEGLTGFIDALPELIGLLEPLTKWFGDLGRDLDRTAETFRGIASAIDWLSEKLEALVGFDNWPDWLKNLFEGKPLNGAREASISLPSLPDFGGSGETITHVVELDTSGFDSAMDALLARLDLDLLKMRNDALFTTQSMATSFQNGFVGISNIVHSHMALISLAFLQAMLNMQLQAGVVMSSLMDVFTTGFATLLATVQTQMAAIGMAWYQGLLNMQLNSGIVFLSLLTVFQTLFTQLLTLVQTQMQLITMTYLNGLLAMQMNTALYLQGVQQAFLTAFMLIGQTVMQQMALIQFYFLQALTNMQLNTGVYLLGVITAFQTALQQIAVLVQTQMALVQFAFLQALTNMQLNAGVILTSIITVFQTALQQIVVAVQVQMALAGQIMAAQIANMVAIVNNGMAQIRASVATSMAAVTAAIVAGMAAATAAVIAGVAAMTAAFIAGMNQMVAAAAAAMAAILAALAFAAVVAQVVAGVAACINAVNRLIDGFRSAGANAIAALAGAIRAGASAVISAASWVATQAINAAKWALGIKSPSREFLSIGGFMMAGWQNGIRDNARGLVRSIIGVSNQLVEQARRVGQKFQDAMVLHGFGSEIQVPMIAGIPEAVAAVRDLSGDALSASIDAEDFTSIGEHVEAALATWGITIDRDGIAKLVNSSNIRKARRR